MTWQQDEDWKLFQQMKAQQRKGSGKGKGAGKGGKGAHGNGHEKVGPNPKVPCLDSRCTAWSYRNETKCHRCWAPLNKDRVGGKDDALPSQRRRTPAKNRDRSVSRQRALSGRSDRSRSTTNRGAEKRSKKKGAKPKRSQSKQVSYKNADQARKDWPPLFPDSKEQMEIDSAASPSDPPSSAALLTPKDLVLLGLTMPSKPANFAELLKVPVDYTAPATPAQVVAQAAPSKASNPAAASKYAADMEKQAKLMDAMNKEMAATIRKSIPPTHGGSSSTETKVTVETLRQKRQGGVVDKENLVARLEKSRLGAQSRHEKLRATLVKERDLLNEKIHAFDERLVVVHAQHAANTVQSIGHLSAVLAEWDVVIDASAARVEANLLTLAPAALAVSEISSGSQVACTGGPASLVCQVDPQPKLVQQQPQQQVQQQQLEKAAEIDAKAQDYFLTAEWDPEVVVGLNVTVGAQSDYLNCLWYQTAEWFKTGLIQISYANLFADPVDATGPMQALRGLLGASYWDALYGSRSVLASDLVPQQMYHVIMSALECIASTLKEGAEKKGATEGTEMKSKAAGRFKLLKQQQILKTKSKVTLAKSSKP